MAMEFFKVINASGH